MRAVASIRVDERSDGAFDVEIRESGSRTSHRVTVEDAYAQKLTGGAVSTAELVRRSFEFLLEREPKESILDSFALPVIGRYFPEYEREIRGRIAAPPSGGRQHPPRK
jgi:hypothetical protein